MTSLAADRLLADETTFGIGAAINDNIKLYFPINTDRFLIETTVVYTNSKREF
ncbi:MAG: hypothetical protein GXP15_16145 [Gammaproteobacteria bacterium]|nr:hypothetical protein [Gammaproteobacteria bacterium]